MHQHTLQLPALSRGLHDITAHISQVVRDAGAPAGLCHVFVHHTSASLIIQENADPDVLDDLEHFLSRLVPDGDRRYQHRDEGPDDMPAHIKCALTASSLTIPVLDERLALGTWQGVYLWEHRDHARSRRLTVSIQGT